jgi:type I restriction enzyme S subunit
MSELPSSWAWTTLEEIASTSSGGTPSRARPDFYGGLIPWVKSGELNDGLVQDVEEKITEEALANSSAKIFSSGTLCIALYGATVGKVGILAMDAATNQAICGIMPRNQIRTKYLFHFFQSLRSELIGKSVGGAQPNISQQIVRSTQVPICAPPEQDRIVAEIDKQFTRLDAATVALKRVQANLKRYRASVLKAACEGRLVPTEAELARKEGRDHEPADKLLQRILRERRARWEADTLAKMQASGKRPSDDRWKQKYKEPSVPDTSNLPELPEGWCCASLGQAFGVHVGATPSRGVPAYWNGSIPWVSSGEVAFCRIGSTRESITELGLRETSTDVHPPGTVLIGMIGEGKTRGQVAILDIAACNNQNSAAIRVSETGLPPEFIYRYLEGIYEQTRNLSSGNNQPALNKARVQEIIFPMPPLEEQRRICMETERLLSVTGETEKACRLQVVKGHAIRNSILRDAFTGQLVPQDPNDEPASALLERIRAERVELSKKTVARRAAGKRGER